MMQSCMNWRYDNGFGDQARFLFAKSLEDSLRHFGLGSVGRRRLDT